MDSQRDGLIQADRLTPFHDAEETLISTTYGGVIKNELCLASDAQFIKQAIDETISLPPPTKAFTGPYKEAVENILQQSHQELSKVRGFSPDLLANYAYQCTDARERYRDLSGSARAYIEETRQRMVTNLSALSRTLVLPDLAANPLESGILEVPPYRQQRRRRECTTANFTMLFSAITGHPIPQDQVSTGIMESAADSLMDDEDSVIVDTDVLLNIFRAPVFKERFGVDVTSIPLYGAGFAEIEALAAKIRSLRPQARIFCMVNLGSHYGDGIYHDGILLSSNSETVTLHDPARFYGQEFRKWKLHKFTRLWAQAFMRGNLIVARPRKS